MRLGIIQCPIKYPESLKHLLSLYQGLEADLAVAPELVLTGDEIPSLKEVERRLQPVREAVKRQKIPLLLGLAHPEGPYNQALLLEPGRERVVAEKINLFPAFDLKAGFKPGRKVSPFYLNDLSLGAIICFDLRFPEITRALVNRGAKVILVLAAWPRERIHHFKALLRARAIENQVFVCGINAIGRLGDFDLAGESSLYDPWGEEQACLKEIEGKSVSLDLSLLKKSRAFFLTSKNSFFLSPTDKILSLEELQKEAQQRRLLGQKMVFTNGCFDLLHAGHVDYLFQARKLGDFLVVGLNSDASIRKIKGPSRPINPEKSRAQVLAALACVDYVVLFDEETPERLIRTLSPDFLVKGADWPEEKIVGASWVKSYGGKVVRIPFKHQISTTQIIEKIRKNHG